MEKLLNLIFIPECIFCHQEGSFFCERCFGSCKRSDLQFVDVKKFPIKFMFAYEYERFVRECIRNAKYRNKQFAALKVLSEKVAGQMAVQLNAQIKDRKAYILPVPVSPAKLAKRGFNQAQIIAEKFSKQLKIPLKTNILLRSKETTSQYTNSKKQRFENLRNAFTLRDSTLIKEATIILIDDVCTTGATFLEAARVLLKAGAKQVVCVSLARKSLEGSS